MKSFTIVPSMTDAEKREVIANNANRFWSDFHNAQALDGTSIEPDEMELGYILKDEGYMCTKTEVLKRIGQVINDIQSSEAPDAEKAATPFDLALKDILYKLYVEIDRTQVADAPMGCWAYRVVVTNAEAKLCLSHHPHNEGYFEVYPFGGDLFDCEPDDVMDVVSVKVPMLTLPQYSEYYGIDLDQLENKLAAGDFVSLINRSGNMYLSILEDPMSITGRKNRFRFFDITSELNDVPEGLEAMRDSEVLGIISDEKDGKKVTFALIDRTDVFTVNESAMAELEAYLTSNPSFEIIYRPIGSEYGMCDISGDISDIPETFKGIIGSTLVCFYRDDVIAGLVGVYTKRRVKVELTDEKLNELMKYVSNSPSIVPEPEVYLVLETIAR